MGGLEAGFRITNHDRPYRPARQANHRSVLTEPNRSLVEQQIREELANGRYRICPPGEREPTIVSALGAVPKPDSDRIRVIHDASRPFGRALNDYATNDSYSCSKVEHAAALVAYAHQSCSMLNLAAALVGVGHYMAKVDLSSAYRSVRLHPDDHHIAGLAWIFEGDTSETLMHDTRLMFGARLSASVFNRLTAAVVRILRGRGHTDNFVVYCDDFFITHATKEGCRGLMGELLSLLRELGFAISYPKVVCPCTRLTFLGVEIDSVEHTLALPAPKMRLLQEEIAVSEAAKTITKRELQSLVGKLSWAAQVIYGGRTHLRRLLDRVGTLSRPHYKTRITREMAQDLRWWGEFSAGFNGRSPIIDNRAPIALSIDACNSGAGGYCEGDWYHLQWSDWPGVANHHINYKEVLSLVPAVAIWGNSWANRRVTVYSDNQAAVAIINRGTAKDPLVMDYLRGVFWCSAVNNFKIRAIYYPGRQNGLADAASRLSNPGGAGRLAAALSGTLCHYGRGRPGCAGGAFSDSGLRPQHPAGLHDPPAGLHSILPGDPGGARPGHLRDFVPLRGAPRAAPQVSEYKAIH